MRTVNSARNIAAYFIKNDLFLNENNYFIKMFYKI